MTSTIDTIRALFTYGIATIVMVGGGLFLFFTPVDQVTGRIELTPAAILVAGFMGSAMTFVFGQEQQTRTARQSTASAISGAALHANGSGGKPDPGA